MSGVAWDTVKNAIQQAVVLGSALAGNKVIWQGQRDSHGNIVPRPSGTYIALGVLGLRQPGFDDSTSYDVSANVLQKFVQGPRIIVLSIKVYQGIPTGTDDIGPLQILSDVLTATGSDDVTDVLTAAFLGIGTYDDAQVSVQKLNESKQEVFAFTTVQIHTKSDITFTKAQAGIGWIDNVNIDGTVTTERGAETVTVSVSNP